MNDMMDCSDIVDQFGEVDVHVPSDSPTARENTKNGAVKSSNLAPLASAWSIFTDNLESDVAGNDVPAGDNEVNQLPDPPAAVLQCFELLCENEVQSYLKAIIRHYKSKKSRSKTFLTNELTSSHGKSPSKEHAGPSDQNLQQYTTPRHSPQFIPQNSHFTPMQCTQLANQAHQTQFSHHMSNITPEKERMIPEHNLHFSPQHTLPFACQQTLHSTSEQALHFMPQQTLHPTHQQTLHFTTEHTLHPVTPQQISQQTETSHSTPHTSQSTPQQTLHVTPQLHVALQSTSQQTSHSTPQQISHPTPQQTLHFSPQQTMHSTPQQTAHATPQQTLHATPHISQSTPQQTLHFTPQQTLQSIPQQTSHSTPQQTLHSTPQQTLHSTPQQTLHSTPQQTSIISQDSDTAWTTPVRRSPRKHEKTRKLLQAADDRERSADDDRVRLLASSDISVSRKSLRMATSAAAKAKDSKAAFTLTSKLLPCLFTIEELAASRGQGLRAKKEGDTRLPLDSSRVEVLRDYVTAWCLKNGKGSKLRDQDFNDAITEKISYCRKKVKKQT